MHNGQQFMKRTLISQWRPSPLQHPLPLSLHFHRTFALQCSTPHSAATAHTSQYPQNTTLRVMLERAEDRGKDGVSTSVRTPPEPRSCHNTEADRCVTGKMVLDLMREEAKTNGGNRGRDGSRCQAVAMVSGVEMSPMSKEVKDQASFTYGLVRRRCRQNTHSQDTFVHVQRITERTAQMFHSRNTRGSRLRIAVSPKQFVIPASCLTCCHTCHRTLLHNLSPTSPAFRPSSPSLSCPASAHSGLEQEPRRSH